jgi:thiol-disulfide isomerase/thioredoxin
MKILFFTGLTCHACNQLKPVLAAVADELNIPVDYHYRESDPINSFGKYKVMSIPTVIILKNGQPYWSHTGTMSRTECVRRLSQLKEDK